MKAQAALCVPTRRNFRESLSANSGCGAARPAEGLRRRRPARRCQGRPWGGGERWPQVRPRRPARVAGAGLIYTASPSGQCGQAGPIKGLGVSIFSLASRLVSASASPLCLVPQSHQGPRTRRQARLRVSKSCFTRQGSQWGWPLALLSQPPLSNLLDSKTQQVMSLKGKQDVSFKPAQAQKPGHLGWYPSSARGHASSPA